MHSFKIMTRDQKVFVINSLKFIQDSEILNFLYLNQDDEDIPNLDITYEKLNQLNGFYTDNVFFSESVWNFEFQKYSDEEKISLFQSAKYLDLEMFLNRYFYFLKHSILQNEEIYKIEKISPETICLFEKKYERKFKKDLLSLIFSDL
jgi:hypothetical protein